jgi:hypothetical protein
VFVEEVGGCDVAPLVRICTRLKPPAYLQNSSIGIDSSMGTDNASSHIPTCDPAQLSNDLGLLLQSGQGADVELRCAGGEVVRAHSAILMARWEWFRARQASGMTATCSTTTGVADAGEIPEQDKERAAKTVAATAEATKGAAAASGLPTPTVVVDTSGHSGEAMQMVLQHLYTGRVQLPSYMSQLSTQGHQAGGGNDGDQHEQDKDCHADHMGSMISTLSAASYFLLPDLHAAIVTLAQKLFIPRTALSWLQAAHEAGDEELGKAAYDFTRAHIAGVLPSATYCSSSAPMQVVSCCSVHQSGVHTSYQFK